MPSLRKRVLCLLMSVALVATALLVASAETTVLLPWDEDRPLTWNDFRGTPLADAMQRLEGASIMMSLKTYASYTVDRPSGQSNYIGWLTNITVGNYMNPDKSWVLMSVASAALLAHEQGHFDLNEVYRRKMAESLGALRMQGTNQYDVETQLVAAMNATIQSINDQATAACDEYDLETDHGRDANLQSAWQDQIEEWLENPLSAPSSWPAS